MRTLLCLGLLAATVSITLWATPSIVHSDESKAQEKLIKKRRARLRTRAVKWLGERKRLVGKCTRCKGQGYIVKLEIGAGGGRYAVDCPTCEKRKKAVYSSTYLKLFYEMYSPAFRAMRGIKDELTNAYKLANHGDPWPEDLNRYRIRKHELVDAEHGVVWTEWNRDKTPKPMKWIWATEFGKKRGNWFVYSEASDGAWPLPEQDSDQEGKVGGKASADTTLTKEEDAAVRDALRDVRKESAFLLVGIERDGNCLLLFWRARAAVPKKVKPEEAAGEAAVDVVRELFPCVDAWESVRSTWSRNWRDKFGQVESLPFYTSSFSRSDWAKVKWHNLTLKEQISLLSWETHVHEGYIIWDK